MVEKIVTVILMLVCIICVAAGTGLLLAFPVKWCWNYVMPTLFGLKMITWGQAWCLHFLAVCFLKATQMNNAV